MFLRILCANRQNPAGWRAHHLSLWKLHLSHLSSATLLARFPKLLTPCWGLWNKKLREASFQKGCFHEAAGGVLKNGRDLTYLLRWTAKPGAVTGDPTACKSSCGWGWGMFLRRLNVKDGPGKDSCTHARYKYCKMHIQNEYWRHNAKGAPAVNEFQIVSQIRNAGICGKNEPGRKSRRKSSAWDYKLWQEVQGPTWVRLLYRKGAICKLYGDISWASTQRWRKCTPSLVRMHDTPFLIWELVGKTFQRKQ